MQGTLESARGFDIITKDDVRGARPNLGDYDTVAPAFRWESVRRHLEGLPHGGGLNIAHETVDRHARGAAAARIALRWLGRSGEVREFSYADLAAETSRFANVLQKLGIGKGDRVFGLMGRVPELYIAALGTLKAGAVFCPLFSAFGPDPIKQRLQIGEGRVLVTTPSLYKRKVEELRGDLPDLETVLLVGDKDEPTAVPDTRDYRELMAAAPTSFVIPPTDPEDMALLHFTSGTTGTPKGAVHVHQAVLHHYITGLYALDFHPGDVFWCTADPGWVTGTSYGIIAPLLHGITNVVDEGDLDADRWYGIIAKNKVTVWYTAPTAVRMLMRVGAEAAKEYDLSSLRFIGSVGEPLNPEAVVWGQEAFGLPIHDNWWQTETGGIMIANYRSMAVKPGSMGRPLPGIRAAIVHRLEGGKVEEVTAMDTEGELALEPGWPSMFRGYLHDDKRYQKCFVDGWYLTGDLARRDADGYYWFVGRADDVIKSAGHLIGPFEVESALLEHPAVAEAGVIGVPDPVVGELVKAFVTLHKGFEPSEALQLEIQGHARKRLGPVVAPKAIEFRDSLPHTRSGKIMRRLLKARELGLPEGDISTLEGQG
ncbi:MAG: acetate--CoA ligase [Deinococcales bacterium]